MPSSIPVAEAGTAVTAVRAARLAPGTQVLAGHFGTFSRETRPLLDQAIARVLDRSNNVTIVCFGRGSDEYVAAAFGVGPSGSGRENRETGIASCRRDYWPTAMPHCTSRRAT